MRTRYFQVGFNRAGTSAIAEMLAKHGFNTVHHTVERNGNHVNIAFEMHKNIESGRAPLDGFDEIDVFTDVEYVTGSQIIEGNRYFMEVATAYPEMKFILNIRSKEDWIKSRLRFNDYPSRWMEFYGIDKDSLEEMWSKDWDEHIKSVKCKLPDSQLLIFDIESPDQTAIQRFFEIEERAVFRQRNKSVHGPMAKVSQKVLPMAFLKLFPNKLKNVLKNI